MNYSVYKMHFRGNVHFGIKTLESCQFSFYADTLFSALCVEAAKEDEALIKQLYEAVIGNKLLVSDALPFVGEDLLLPKPLSVKTDNAARSSVLKKKYKKLGYIPLSSFDDYVNDLNSFDAERAGDILSGIGTFSSKESVQIKDDDDSEPFIIGSFRFNPECGLYVVVAYEGDSEKELFDKLFKSLSFSGIGGKKSSGMGRFTLEVIEADNDLVTLLNKESDSQMTISIAMPAEDERVSALEGAEYNLLKRSGFVYSETYSDTECRKKDFYSFAAGSCFRKKFSGDIYDVSDNGKHPVYRYAKPLFIGV